MASNITNSPPTPDSFARPVSGVDAQDSPDDADLANDHSDALEQLEAWAIGFSIYAPTPAGNGLSTFTSTWAGKFKEKGGTLELSLVGEVKGNWAGTGFISIPLPAGYTCAFESSGAAWGNPMPNGLGVHWFGTAVAHQGATEVHIVSGQGTWVAADTPGFATASASTDLLTWSAVHGLSAGDRVVIGAADQVLAWPGFCVGNLTTDLLTTGSAHGLVAGDKVIIGAADGAAIPAPLTIGGTYYVIAAGLTTTAFSVSTTAGGSAVNLTTSTNCTVQKISTTPTGLTIGVPYFVIASGLTTTACKLATTSGGSAINLTTDGTLCVTRQQKVRSVWDLATDGVNSPPGQAFTGDGTAPNDDMIYVDIDVDIL